MASFYEVVAKIPSDLEEHLPGICDDFVSVIMSKEWRLPESSDLVLDQIDQPKLTIADAVRKVFYFEWLKYCRDVEEPLFFFQFEKGKENFHVHMVIETSNVSSMVLGRYIGTIKKKLVRKVFREVEPQMPDWLAVTKTKQSGGVNKTYDKGYIPAYLLPKTQPELQWAWTNIEEYKSASLNLAERKRLVDEFLASLRRDGPSQSEPDDQQPHGPVIRNRTSQKYMALVSWLVENGITSEKQWIQEDQESYLSFNAAGSSRSQIKSALDNASRIMSLTKKASDYLVGQSVPEDITENKIYQLFKMNGYDPAYLGSILLGWCQGRFGKRNTVWLYGPATTGKTNLAEAIAHSVPFYGCVNWTNENFPFNDCVDKMLIWWEEGKMTSKVVESAKAILGGSKVRVDQKCKSSVQIDSTPVIITSNTDMCCVIDGNSTTFEHRQPLEDRMFRINLEQRLSHDFGKITKREVREFLAWAQEYEVDVEHTFEVTKLAKPKVTKRSAPLSDDYKSPAKRARLIPDLVAEEATSSALAEAEEWDLNWDRRYDCRCEAHSMSVRVEGLCRDCEYLNRGKNMCLVHGDTGCHVCHAVPPWVSDPDDCTDEQ
ncbi:Rep78 [California sea lion adeno-associated virus 1]|uniref:Rep78 n=1 Tax=California sea lion adeno-associated virus 1 TaxID=1073950 RepID=G1JYZ2_9VIRU|nr:Rep78 [California sea lion adeno-associated virus 1]AEM37641.1 Rep78 [California sea lion adeno-associated virus 1]AEM37643.1 Rep78 [California sea lion adeno-associated virus 1]